MIRDKFVFGWMMIIWKSGFCERLDGISLDKLIQRTESFRQQVKEMTISHVKAAYAISENKLKEFLCGWYGHKHRPNPTYGQQCTACHKLHHFAKVCHIKQLINVNKNTKSPNASNFKKVHTAHEDDTSYHKCLHRSGWLGVVGSPSSVGEKHIRKLDIQMDSNEVLSCYKYHKK